MAVSPGGGLLWGVSASGGVSAPGVSAPRGGSDPGGVADGNKCESFKQVGFECPRHL